MTYSLSTYISHPTSDQLLTDLRRTARKTHRPTISNQQYRQLGAYAASTITRRFGTWNNALQQAGLKVTKHYNVPVEQLFQNLQRLWQSLGRQPHLSDLFPPLSQYSRRPYIRTFGSWGKALTAFIATKTTKKTLQQPPRGSVDINTPSSKPALSIAEGDRVGVRLPPRDSVDISAPSLSERAGARFPPRDSVDISTPSLSERAGVRHSISWRLRHLIMKRDNFRCKACGASPATNPQITLHIDHIIPASHGGPSTPENLQTLCSVCNIGKSNL